MSDYSTRIKELRLENKYSQQALSTLVGMSKSSINMYERGEREPGIETLKALAGIFNVDLNYITGASDIRKNESVPNAIPKFPNIFPIETKRIPLLGEIACGEPIYADEERESYVLSGINIQADFCLKCKGDSMINARILDGDIVFIKSQPMVENGEIAAVIINDEVALKRVSYFPEKNMLVLKPENSKYDDFVYIGDELNNIRILGKAIAFQSDVR